MYGLDSHICVFDDFIPNDICEALMEECRKYHDVLFYEGPTIGGVDRTIKNCLDFDFSMSNVREAGVETATFEKCAVSITAAVSSAIDAYFYKFPELDNQNGFYNTGFRLQHYLQNIGGYKKHCDGMPWDEEPINRRVLAIIVYLNSVTNGGGTYFPQRQATISAKQGRIALFPSSWTHPHVGQIPISNDKWIISSFFMSNPNTPAVASAEITPMAIDPTIISMDE